MPCPNNTKTTYNLLTHLPQRSLKMGQRTQVISVIRTDLPNFKKTIDVQILHNQWGFGKVMPLLLASKITQLYSVQIPSFFDLNSEQVDSERMQDLIDTIRFDTHNTNYSDISQDYTDEFKIDFADQYTTTRLNCFF